MSEDNTITLKRNWEGDYKLLHKGEEWNFSSDEFHLVMEKMNTLRTKPKGDPK
ncbi:MAG: hypothetical protein ACPHER_11635 [Nevskiales bacterium]